MAGTGGNPPDPYGDIYGASDDEDVIRSGIDQMGLGPTKEPAEEPAKEPAKEPVPKRYVPLHLRGDNQETPQDSTPPAKLYRAPWKRMERTNLGQEAINRDWRSVNPPEEQQDDEMSWRRNTSDPVPQRNDPEPSENPPDIPPPADVPRRVVPDYPPRQIPEQLIQHGRSTPGYPRWRRTQEEINAATESIWRRPVPEPEVYVPYLGPRASTLEADEISRIQTRGRWYIRSLPVMSRYFTREPAEKAELASEHRHDPYDLVLVLKDAHRLQTPEDFVEAILRELSTTGEYSQEIASHGKAERGGLPTRQTHANRAGRDLLEDFDLIIEEILKLQGELEIANQANSADRLFEAIAEAYGWDSTELKKSGFHQEIMSYVGIAMMGRLRYIRDFVQFDHATQEGDIMNDIDDSTITLATRQFSAAIHSASLADDVRMIEWYSYWSALFPGRHRREFEMNPHLNTQKMLNLFRDVYGFEHKYAVRLLSDSGFAEDVYIIDSFIGVRGTTNAVEPSKHAYYRGVADQYYKPYIQALIDTLDKHPVTDGTLWRRYRASPNSVPDLRRRLVQYMDKNQKPAYVGVGRWCRHKPAPGKPNLGTEHTEMRERGWRRGWYCPDHRPWIRCSSCNWKYSCAICTNPHSCPHCNQAFTCIAPGCNIRSDRYRDGRRKDYTYNVAETVKGEGWIQNGRRITPRPRNILSRMHLPPRYRAFFPKDVSDIPEEGPIFTKPVSARYDPRFCYDLVYSGWQDGYPSKEAPPYARRLGGEGFTLVQEWEVPKYPGHVPVPPAAGGGAHTALVEENAAHGGTPDKRRKRKRGEDKGLLGDVSSALRLARRVKR